MARLNYDVRKEDVRVRKAYSATKIRSLIEEFQNSGKEIAEVVMENGEYTHPRYCANSIYCHLKATHNNTVRSIYRKGRVFLVREENTNG